MEIDNKDTDTYRTYVKDLDPNKVTYVVFFLYSNRDYKYIFKVLIFVGHNPNTVVLGNGEKTPFLDSKMGGS